MTVPDSKSEPKVCISKWKHTLGALLLLILFLFAADLPLWAAPAPQAASPTPSLLANTSTAQRIRARGNVLIAGVLYDYKPFGFLDPTGTVTGFDVDLVTALAAAWGVEVQFVPVTPSTRLQSLVAGQVDLVAAALPHTVADEKAIDFSVSYFTDQPSLLMRADGTVSLNALAGRVIAAVQGDRALAQLQAYLQQSATTVTILPFQEYAPALMAVRAGQADALLGHSVHLAQVAQDNLGVSLILPLDGQVAFALGVAPGDAHFRALVDATLQQLQENGDYAAIYAKWFPGQTPPTLETLPGVWPYTLANLPATVERPTVSRLAQLRARGKLSVGVPYDLPPFGIVDSSGVINGFHVALAQELARRWLGDAAAVALVQVTPDTALPLLQAGQVDLVIGALPHTWNTEAEIDFSITYFVDTLRLLTRADRTMTTPTALSGKTIAAVAGRATLDTIAAQLADNGVTQVDLLPFPEFPSAVQALLAGQVDAVIGSGVVFSDAVQGNPTLALLPIVIERQPYAVGIGQFDDELRDLVNFTLQAMQADGAYAAIYQRWFADPPYRLTTWSGDSLTAPVAVDAAAGNRVTPPAVTVTPTVAASDVNEIAATTVTTSPITGRSSILIPTATPTAPTVTGRSTGAKATPTPTLAISAARLPLSTTLTTTVVSTAGAAITSPAVITATIELTSASDLTATKPLSTTPSPLATATPITPRPRLAEPTQPATVTTTLPTTVTVLSALNLNVRTRPAATAPIVRVLPGGTAWRVLGVTDDREWVQLQLPDGLRGWVLRTLLTEAAAFPTPIQPPPTPMPTPTATPVIVLLATPVGTPGVVAPDGSTRHLTTATDTLATIAQRYYGQQRLWTLIYAANQTLIGPDPNVIPVGVALVIPPEP